MMEPNAFSYLEKARLHANEHRYSIAFDFYIKAAHLDPRVRQAVEYEFRAVLTKYNHHLAYAEGNRAQIFNNFIIAMTVYPGNTNILSGIGKYLMKNALYTEALCHFEKAVQIDSNLVDLEKNFDSAKRFLFQRNNFRYLNDEKRKAAYLLTSLALQPKRNSVRQTAKSDNNDSKKLASVSDRIIGKGNIHDLLKLNNEKGYLEISDLFNGNTLFMMNRFGPGLFKDKILDTLQKTYEDNLLEDRRVTPSSAEYFIVGAKCDRVNSRFQLSTDAKELLKIPNYIVHVHYKGEAFHGKDIPTYKDLEYVTGNQELFKIDFNNYCDVVEKNKGTTPYTAILKANKDTEINVLVGWFNLHLMEGVTLSTDPQSADRTDAWPQAVFFDFIPRPVKENENVSIQFMIEGELKLLSDAKRTITRLSASIIAFLNDSLYVHALMAYLSFATVYLAQICQLSEIDIADMCPFPIFGMFMLMRGARSLVCYARYRYDKEFIERVFQENNIPLSKVTILTPTQWNFFDKEYHLIMYNALALSGDIDSQLCQVIYHLRYSHLVDGGLTMPANVNLIGQLISSDHLDTLNKVKEDGPMSPLAPHLNMFQALQAHGVDPFRLEYEALSDPTLISTNCLHMEPDTITVPVTKDGKCNAILCWYEINLVENDREISTFRRNSFVDTTAFLVKQPVKLHCGDTVSVIRCVDNNGSFKLTVDLDIL